MPSNNSTTEEKPSAKHTSGRDMEVRAQPWKEFFNQASESEQSEDIVTVARGGDDDDPEKDIKPHVAA